MKIEVIIREAVESDLPAILSLHAELEDSRSSSGLTLERATEIFRKLSQYPNYRIFIASSEDQVVGTFALLVMDNLAHDGSLSGVVEDVVVGKKWQGKGIGKTMMRFALDKCRQQGCYKLTLSSNSKRTQAHHFYESLGFLRHGYSFSTKLSSSHDRPSTA